MPRLVIAGTGTGAGKTYFSAALVRALRAKGSVCALKPIESGYSGLGSDAELVAAGGVWVPPLYGLQAPLSPHLAARLEQQRVDLGRVRAWVEKESTGADWVVIESAGGLFSPLDDEGRTNLDLVRVLQPCLWLLVAPNRLGVLHEVGASYRAARGEQCEPLAIVLSAGFSDASSATNVAELRRVLPAGAPPVESLGNGAELSPEFVADLIARCSAAG